MRYYWDLLMGFLDKKDFDDMKGDVHPYQYYGWFRFWAVMFRIVDNEKLPKWTRFTPIFTTTFCSIAVIIWVVAISHNVIELYIPNITESSTYLVIVCYDLLIISTTYNPQSYHELCRAMRDDFTYVCTVGEKYRERFFTNHRLTFKCSCLSLIFVLGIGSGVCGTAALAFLYFLIFRYKDYHNPDIKKPLPYYVWFLDIDFNTTPNYEIMLVLLIVCTMAHTMTYGFMLQNEIIWIRQITSKADLIIWNIQDLLADVQPANNKSEERHYNLLIKHRMNKIIQMHQAMYILLDNYSKVYRKMLIVEQSICGPLIGIAGFCIVSQFEVGQFNLVLTLIWIAAFVVLFVPAYLCTYLLEKCQAVGYSCFETPFWNATGTVIRSYLFLIMQRSMRPLPINAAGFREMTLETYANSISNAYKYFTLLRQADIDIV